MSERKRTKPPKAVRAWAHYDSLGRIVRYESSTGDPVISSKKPDMSYDDDTIDGEGGVDCRIVEVRIVPIPTKRR